MKLHFPTLLLFLAFSFFSCSEDEGKPEGQFSSGLFVINEGNFNEADGSISHFDPLTQKVSNNIFKQVNREPLGDVVQSMFLSGEDAYIIVNNSNKVEVVKTKTMKRTTALEASMPRYMVGNGTKGYLTEWVSFGENGRVSVIDLQENVLSSSIEVGPGAEYPFMANDKLYVSNNLSNTVSVVNIESETEETKIEVGNGPGHIVQDVTGYLWVINAGGYDATWMPLNDGGLSKIDPETNEVVSYFSFNSNGTSKLFINPAGDVIYYALNNDLYAMDITASELPSTPFINNSDIMSLYGVGINPYNGDIYLADIKTLNENGTIHYYTSDGILKGSFIVGRGPNGFAFLP